MEAYRRFVAEGKNQPSPWQGLRNQVYLGDERFVERMQRRIDEQKVLSEIPVTQRRRQAKTLAYYERKEGSRDEAIISAYASGGYTLKEIGDYFGLHYSWISRIVEKAKKKT